MLDAPLLHQEKKPLRLPKRPYRGLAFFTAADVALFGERDEEILDASLLLGLPTTRVLLLHGLSGVGKSSFLRAGLLPQLSQPEEQDFDCPRAKDEYDIVRSTEDPLLQILEALRRWCAEEGPYLPSTPAETKRRIMAELEGLDGSSDRRVMADRLLKALVLQSTAANRTLVICIDQAEEVITLATPSDTLGRSAAFFDFLLHLCSRHIDLKLIIALRTEYYGQFCFSFGLDPAGRHAFGDRPSTELLMSTPKRGATIAGAGAGPEQFMLGPIREEKKLREMILRPTSKTPLGKEDEGPGTPFEKYGFTYTDKAVSAIVADLQSSSLGVSALPVLQVACRGLYEQVVKREHRNEITLGDYNKLGKVEGRVSSYVDDALRAILKREDAAMARLHRRISDRLQRAWRGAWGLTAPLRRGYVPGTEIERWRQVLCELVRQTEGGATTTKIQSETHLVNKARECGIRAARAQRVLRGLESRQWMILRSIATGESKRYSLSHDTIANILASWEVGFRQKLKEREARFRRARTGLIMGGTAAGLGLAGWIISSEILTPRRIINSANNSLIEHIQSTQGGSQQSEISTYGVIRNLLAALRQRETSWAPWAISTDEAEKTLASVVAASPLFIGFPTASGTQPDGNQLVFLKRDLQGGAPTVETLDLQRTNPADLKAGLTKQLGAISSEKDRLTTTPPTVGFIGKDNDPVVYANGRVYLLKDGQWLVIDHMAQSSPEKEVMSYGFPEIAANELRLNVFTGRSRTLATIPGDALREVKKDTPISTVTLEYDRFNKFVPTVGIASPYYVSANPAVREVPSGDSVRLLPALDVEIRSLADKEALATVRVDRTSDEATPDFNPAVSFSRDGSHVVVRPGLERLVVFANPLKSQDARTPPVLAEYRIPTPASNAAIRSSTWERPQVTAHISGTETLFAWPVNRGIMLLRGPAPNPAEKQDTTQQVLFDGVPPSTPGYVRLQFSGDGRFLIQYTIVFGAATYVRVWDLRLIRPPSTTRDNLIEEACGIVGRTTPPTTTLPVGRRTVTLEGKVWPDPCPSPPEKPDQPATPQAKSAEQPATGKG